MGTMEPLVERA